MLSVEIIEGCNFKCYFCVAKHVETNVYMNKDLFKRIVLEARELGINRLKLTPHKGEPFLHPDIYEILEFANDNMSQVDIFTNATAINIDKLSNIRFNNINLYISEYGSNGQEFSKLTCMPERLRNIFDQKVLELKQSKIKHEVCHRSLNYVFDYEAGPRLDRDALNPNTKCVYHQVPKILANGDVTFCNFAMIEFSNSKKIRYANINETTLKSVLENPIRYKFMDSQSVCIKYCTSANRTCHNEHNIITLKLIAASKKNYQAEREIVDQQYKEIEDEVAQSSLQSTKP